MQYVQIITTGGTIASFPNESGDVSVKLSGEQLVERLGIKENIKVTSSVTLGSYMFDYETLYQVAVDVIEALENKEVKGVVITHGTDTMEETAYYLSLVTSRYSKPIMLTGAQLDASYSYSDGMKNLQDVICAAKDSRLKDYGPLIVFAGFIHAARDVKKVDTSAIEGFDSPVWGPIGRVDNEQVVINRKVISQSFIHKPVVPTPVALIRLAIGMTG
ncbi:asparaginase domain-containing protein [Caldifermentibacillus hisashii]|uniref:asparaginase domain-containing protein n=1 Tax=Caldifermentibacillus hisashii TaxID=996558 RepID=UPI0031FC673B